jgi:hypothetical protein
VSKLLATLVIAAGLVVVTPTMASAADCDYGSENGSGGTSIGGGCQEPVPDPASGDGDYSGYEPSTGPPPPVYEYYYTPACSPNGPPGQGNPDALCQGAVSICEAQGGDPGDLYMQVWRREVPGGNWESMGSECRGADDPAVEEPEATPEMVLDEAYAEAPRPTANVQPGTRSFVNVPNNYFAEAAGDTITVNVLGNPIQVTFTVNEITWDFGDGTSATGKGVEDASVGDVEAVEHAYAAQGEYAITANTTVGVHFTLPNGQQIDEPNAFSFSSDPVELPVGEIQTRVESTN